MPEERVVVEVDLRVERKHALVSGHDQGIDLRKGGIGLVEGLVQGLQEITRLRYCLLRHADLARNVRRVLVSQALHRVDRHLVDFLGCRGRHLLDVHAALARGHEHHPLRAAVDDHANVEFFSDVGAFLDQQAPDFLAVGAGLVGLQLHAENLPRDLLHFF